MEYIKQTPKSPNEWLHNGADGNSRYFTRFIVRPNNVPAWSECTDTDKTEWEEAHKPEEPQEEVVE